MIDAADFLKWLSIFNVPSGSGPPGSVTQNDVQNNVFNYAIDSGTANNYAVTLTPIPVIIGGTSIIMLAINNNTGPSTITVNGSSYNIVNNSNTPLTANEIVANSIFQLIYDSALSAFVLINPVNSNNDWVDETTSPITMISNTGYTSDDGATRVSFSLPLISNIGDWLEINGKGSGLWTILQGSGQQIFCSPNNTTLGLSGSLTSVNQYDNVRLRCLISHTIWTVVSQQSTGLIYI